MQSGRDKSRIKPRLAVYWLCRELLRWSYPEIGRALGKDNTTVLSGCKRYVQRTTALERVRLMLQCAWWPERYETPSVLPQVPARYLIEHEKVLEYVKAGFITRETAEELLRYPGSQAERDWHQAQIDAEFDRRMSERIKPPAAEAG